MGQLVIRGAVLPRLLEVEGDAGRVAIRVKSARAARPPLYLSPNAARILAARLIQMANKVDSVDPSAMVGELERKGERNEDRSEQRIEAGDPGYSGTGNVGTEKPVG